MPFDEAEQAYQNVALTSLVTLESGFPFSSEQFTSDKSEGLPLIRIRDLQQRTTACRYTGKFDINYVVQNGDILVGMDGQFVSVRWAGEDALLNQRVLRVRSANASRLDEEYLFYRLQPDLACLEETISGTTVKHLSTKDIKRLCWSLPPLDEQRRIAEVLRSLDDALAASAATLTQAETLNERVRHGLTGNDASQSEWRHDTLLNCFQLQRGHDLPVQDRGFGAIPVIASNGPVGTHNHSAIKGPAVVTGRSGTIGKVCYFDGPCWPLNTTLFVSDFKGANPRFVFHFLKAFPLTKYQSGTGVPTLNRNDLHAVEVAWPTNAQQDELSTALDALEEAVGTMTRELAQLRALKAQVSRDLLSGRVRVPA